MHGRPIVLVRRALVRKFAADSIRRGTVGDVEPGCLRG